MDIKSKQERSRNMSRIRSNDTSVELYLRKLLFARGYRYFKNYAVLPGSPDVFLKKYNTAILVHGCFWHRHPGCKYAYVPKSNVEDWSLKFERNIARDQQVQSSLNEMGIRVLIIWECTIKRMKIDPDFQNRILEQIELFLKKDHSIWEEL